MHRIPASELWSLEQRGASRLGSFSLMLQELADRAAIIDAVIAYATALDSRNWQKLGALFTDDASWEYSSSGERLFGPDAIVVISCRE
jgi:hypothetical protein